MSKIFLDTNQIKVMYNIAGSRSIRDEVLLRIMGQTGLRVSDCRSLLIEDIVDKNGNVYTSIRKKMKKTSEYVERAINETTRDRIKQYLPMVVGRSVYLFPGSDPSRPIGRTYCHELFKFVLNKLMPEGTDSSGEVWPCY
jgi:integrase